MSVTIDGFDKLGDAIADIIGELRTDDFKEHYERTVVPFVAAVHSEYFSRSAGPSGAWEPWHWRTPDAPTEHNTLIVSQRLAFSMQPGSADNVMEVTETELTYGTSVEYAGIHNFGASVIVQVPLVPRTGKGYIVPGTQVVFPQREFVGLTEPDIDYLTEQTADFVISGLVA